MIKAWKEEENIAHIHGWDFSHIEGRFTEDTNFPWDYRQTIDEYRKPEMRLLDIDTGGGEFLLSLGHPLGASGARVVCDVTRQLRGQAAPEIQIATRRAGMAQMEGGVLYGRTSEAIFISILTI